MLHPEVFLLPVLMIADYYLTILGASLREKKYAEFFQIETYELNPDYRTSIDSKKFISIGFFAQLFLHFAVLFLVSYIFHDSREYMYQIVLGFYLTLFGYINGKHLANLCIFWFVKKHPEMLEGSVKLSHRYNLFRSLFTSFSLLVPIVFIAVFSYSHFVLGALIAVIFKALLGIIWIAGDRNARENET